MRYKNLAITIIVLFPLLLSCKASQKGSGQEDNAASLARKIDLPEYTFVPSSANPMRGGTIQLSGTYSLRISGDSIESYLPYFGRAYTAPAPSSEGGIKFVSTKFDYRVEKNKNGWDIWINTQDTKPNYRLQLNIGASGYATLMVNENNRQSISFYGTIE